jgi:HemY protein
VKWLVAALLLVAVAVGLAILGKYNTGYVLFVVPPYRVDVSLNLVLILAAAAFAFLYALVRVTLRTLALPERVKAFRREQHERRAREHQDAAVVALLEGRYGRAQQQAQAALAIPHSSGLAAIIAARAALEVRDFDRADEFLARPDAQVASLAVPRLMTIAEMQIEQGRSSEALDTLAALRREAGMHTAALRLELRALQTARRWAEVPPLVEQLVKRKVLEPSQGDQLRWRAQAEQLASLAHEARGFRDLWGRLPDADRTHPRVAGAAARAFLELGAGREAADVLARSLDREWSQELVLLFGDCKGADTVRQIEQAEKWLLAHNQDPVLLLVLGRLCQRQSLWGKARTYLEASLAVENTHSAHLALGEMLGHLGETGQANAHLAAAMRLALDRLQGVTGGRREPSI